MPVPAPDGVMDEPEAGWPWQLKHCWVLDVKGTGNSVTNFNSKRVLAFE